MRKVSAGVVRFPGGLRLSISTRKHRSNLTPPARKNWVLRPAYSRQERPLDGELGESCRSASPVWWRKRRTGCVQHSAQEQPQHRRELGDAAASSQIWPQPRRRTGVSARSASPGPDTLAPTRCAACNTLPGVTSAPAAGFECAAASPPGPGSGMTAELRCSAPDPLRPIPPTSARQAGELGGSWTTSPGTDFGADICRPFRSVPGTTSPTPAKRRPVFHWNRWSGFGAGGGTRWFRWDTSHGTEALRLEQRAGCLGSGRHRDSQRRTIYFTRSCPDPARQW